MIDADGSGTITFEELKQSLKRVGSELMESEIQDLMNAVFEFFPQFGLEFTPYLVYLYMTLLRS